jgi:putative Mg2+ transporter-C (MgtC) family protein
MSYISFSFVYVFIALIKLSLSVGMSFLIGIERERHTHPGGACTHILVGIGACLYTMISVYIHKNFDSGNSDPARVCAQIVSGMGFLGSATILKSDNYIKGINTAANLWVCAAISMAIGADLWELALVTSIFTASVLLLNSSYKIYNYKKKDIELEELSSDSEKYDHDVDDQYDHDPLDAPYGDENV